MNARLRKLIDQRATAWETVQDIQDRRSRDGYSPSEEDGTTYTRALDEVERLGRQIEDEQRAERLAAEFSAPADGQGSTNPGSGDQRDGVADAYRGAFSNYLRRGGSGLDAAESRLMEQGFVQDEEVRALAAGADAAGGYTVPKEFLARMIEALKSFGGILDLAEIIPSNNGSPLSWPTNDDTTNKGAILTENTAAAEQDFLFGSANLGAFMFTSKLVRVSRQLLQDSAFNLEVWLPRKLGERIGRAAADYFVSGTGTGQPKGILTGLTKVVETATTAKISYDDLVDLEHSIDSAYRKAAGYVLADTALRDIRKIKDNQGRPLWVPAMAGGVPSTLNGQPYTIDNSFPVTAAGSKSIVYGDIKEAYAIRIVNGAQTLRLAERYAEFLQVGFLGFQRLDGTVQNASAAAVLQLKA